jgi:hypothetical protein
MPACVLYLYPYLYVWSRLNSDLFVSKFIGGWLGDRTLNARTNMLQYGAWSRRYYHTSSVKLDAISGWASNQFTLNILAAITQYHMLFCCWMTKKRWIVKANCKDNENGCRSICSEFIWTRSHCQYRSFYVSSYPMINQIRSEPSCTCFDTSFFIHSSKRFIIDIWNTAICGNLASQHPHTDAFIYSGVPFTSSWMMCTLYCVDEFAESIDWFRHKMERCTVICHDRHTAQRSCIP